MSLLSADTSVFHIYSVRHAYSDIFTAMNINIFFIETCCRCVKMWDLRKNYSSSIPDPMAKHTFNYSGVNKRSHG